MPARGSRWRRFGLGVYVFFAVVGAYVTWRHCYVFRVHLDNPALAAQIRTQALQRSQAFLARKGAADNGFLLVAEASVRDASSDLGRFALSACHGQEWRQPIAQAMREDQPRARMAVEKFLAAYPRIREAVGKPLFVVPFHVVSWPDQTVDDSTRSYPTLKDVFLVSHALRAAALWCALQGQADRALDIHLTHLRYGDRLLEHGSLFEHEGGLGVKSMACEALGTLLLGSELSSQQYGTALAGLSSQKDSSESLLAALDVTFARVMDEADCEVLALGRDANAGGLFCEWLLPRWHTLLRERDCRQYINQYLRVRPVLERLQSRDRVSGDLDGLPLSYTISLDDMPCVVAKFELVHDRCSALAVVAAIRAYKADTGSWPERLDDLVPSTLTRLPALLGAQAVYRFARSGDSFSLDIESRDYDRPGLHAAGRHFSYSSVPSPGSSSAPWKTQHALGTRQQ